MPDKPMTFEEWWASEKAVDDCRLDFDGPMQWNMVRRIACLAWGCGGMEQMKRSHAAEMERLKT